MDVLPVRPLPCRRRPAQAVTLLYLRSHCLTIHDKPARMESIWDRSRFSGRILSTNQVYWLFVLLACRKGAKKHGFWQREHFRGFQSKPPVSSLMPSATGMSRT